MAKKFDLYEELRNAGFVSMESQFGEEVLTREWKVEVEEEICWYGKRKYTREFKVNVWFNSGRTVVEASYYNGSKSPFKTKVHMPDKRAYNAIRQTVENNSFEF